MAEKERIGIEDSKASELSSLEQLDLSEQSEMNPFEKETVDPVLIMQDEVVGQEAPNESAETEHNTYNEVEWSSIPDDAKSDLTPKATETENFLETASEQKEGPSDLDEFDKDVFSGSDDENFDDEPPAEQEPPQEETQESQKNVTSEKKSEEDNKPEQNQKNRKGTSRNSLKSAKRFKTPIALRKLSPTPIIVGLTLLLLSLAAGAFFMNPSLLGYKKKAQTVSLKVAKPTPAEQKVQKQGESPKPLSKNERYLARIADAGLLRDELLEKKKEIYQLKRHYQNGITDLEQQISRELKKEDITSYTEAFKNRHIELKLRTIQRRWSYVHGLEKPNHWLKRGSEELLYLKRKAEIDLQVIDIAGGIDMDKHMRHIDAAIQKFRPSAEKLAVDCENTDLLPLKTIWGQIKNQKKKTGTVLPNTADAEIMKEICSENYERTTELTRMSAATAQCLSEMNGSDLFLNSLTTLSPTAAKYLFQWRGNWICLNGVKELSPAVAQYLFKWKGSWISLNGLIEFPPELATYLMEWEGKQLELMGLRYNKKNADQKALKYLALWETMGGRLFISDDVRKEIERVMM
jgi:hypothetical protein